MEKLRKAVSEIAYTQDHTKLTHLHRSLIPVLSFASSLYRLALSLRRSFYHYGLFTKHRLPVPVISVGNLTWGGNGKTPMVEFIARFLADSGISPLILTRGYAGGDETKMIRRHLLGRPVKIGVGANRAAIAAHFFEKYGYVDPYSTSNYADGLNLGQKVGNHPSSETIGAVVLDDGMQVSEQRRTDIDSMLREVNKSVPIFFTKMDPCFFFNVGNVNSRKPITALSNSILLCVSAIGSADAFVKGMEKIGAFYVDRLEFSDHHIFQPKDIEMMRKKLRELEDAFGSKPVVIVTEKDYDRDPGIFKHLDPYEILALCSELKIIPRSERTEDNFKKLLKVI